MNGSLFNDAPGYDNPNFPPPREFQVSAHQKLRDRIKQGFRKLVLVAPTGAGKTYLGLRIAHESLVRDRKALFICDRTALINQTSRRADEYGLSAHGIIQANHWRYQPEMPFQIASVQTLQSRGLWPQADVVIIDECHTQHRGWVEPVCNGTAAAVIGLTATPCSKGLGLIFDGGLVNAATPHELTQAGILVPLRILSCTKPDLVGVKKRRDGEWQDKDVGEREAKIVGDVVAEWQKYGEGRKTIAFGADIAYCETLVQRFNQQGIHAATFTSLTPDGEREALLKEFRKHDSQIRVLVSVEALAKGFDVEDIGAVIDARPLRKSLSTAIQMWGRGLRSSPGTGKTDCLLLDHSGNILRFMKDFEHVYYHGFESLDSSEKFDREAREEPSDGATPACPQCGYQPFNRRCMSCGHEKKTLALEDKSAGVMREIRIGGQVAAEDRRHLWEQLTAYVLGTSSQKKQGYASNLYRQITGSYPPGDWQIEFTQPAEITRATTNKLRQLRIAYRKAMESRV